MDAQRLHEAADKLAKVAEQRREWAASAASAVEAGLFLGIAQQFQDRADQTRSWARNAAAYARLGQAVPAEVSVKIDAAVCEFLRMQAALSITHN
jgi:hypothetical protein